MIYAHAEKKTVIPELAPKQQKRMSIAPPTTAQSTRRASIVSLRQQQQQGLTSAAAVKSLALPRLPTVRISEPPLVLCITVCVCPFTNRALFVYACVCVCVYAQLTARDTVIGSPGLMIASPRPPDTPGEQKQRSARALILAEEGTCELYSVCACVCVCSARVCVCVLYFVCVCV